MDAGRRTADLLERRPELEDAVAAVLDVDANRETWTFDDVPIDSGAFGELVSAGIVVDADGDGYRVADSEAVRRALDDDVEGGVGTDDASDGSQLALVRAPAAVENRAVGLLLAALAFFAAVRVYVAPAVFRGEHVVLTGNDPYYYLYLVESTVETHGLGWNLVADLPGTVTGGEPLLVATLGVFSGLLGGSGAAGTVLALYPVVAGLLVAVMLYVIAVRVTDDRRVGLASVLLLSVVPAHAFRTSLGYADHHAFDYVWLVLTALALVALLGGRANLRRGRTWLATAALAVGVSAQALAWEGGPLLLLPVAVVVTAQGLFSLRAGRSPLRDLAAPVVGLWAAAGLTLAAHAAFGWHGTSVAIAPLLVAVGATGVTSVSEGARRAGRTARELLAVEVAVAVLGLVGTWLAFPATWDVLVDVFGQVTRAGTSAEAQALIDASSLGFLLVIGPIFLVVAVASLAWGTVRLLRTDESLLVACTYAWFFLLLSLYQIRFLGEFAPFGALFAGLGFVWLAALVDLADPPAPFADGDPSLRGWLPGRPSPRTVGYLLALFVLVGGFGLLQSAIKVEQLTPDEEAYQTAAWIDEHAEAQGWETREEGYVLSRWFTNRMFNYFATGDSQSYGYARSNYQPFVVGVNETAAYEQVRDDVALVVTLDRGADQPTMQSLLHDRHGSHDGTAEGTGHFRARFASASGEYKVFEPVEGALLTGTASANASVRATTDVTVPGASFTYERRATANATGRFSLRVSYEGTYTVQVDGRTQEVVVSAAAVETGARIQLDG